MRKQQRVLEKLHGDAEDSSDRVLTKEEYDKKYGEKALTQLLKQLLHSHIPILFLGCSLGPDRIVKILDDVVKDFPHLVHYAILEAPATDDLLETQRKHSERNIRTIWFPCGGYSIVPRILQQMIDAAGVPAIRAKKDARLTFEEKKPGFPMLALPKGFTVKPINGLSDLIAVFHIEKAVYGSHLQLSEEDVEKWGRRYLGGVYVLKENYDIIGAMGFWPLTHDVYNNLIHGRIDEPGITEGISNSPTEFWYIGDVIIAASQRAKYKRLLLSSYLMEEALQQWRRTPGLPERVEICAIEFTKAGKNLLLGERGGFGFKFRCSTPERDKVYTRSTNLTEIDERLPVAALRREQVERQVAERRAKIQMSKL
jgi:hypothetical protein